MTKAGILGRQRHGKGIIACDFAEQFFREDYYPLTDGIDFYFNGKDKPPTSLPIELDLVEKAINEKRPLLEIYQAKYPFLKKIQVVLDELMVIMDSRASLSKDNRGLSYFAAQSEKQDVPIIYMTQLKESEDLRMRKFADFFCTAEKDYLKIPEDGKLVQYILGFEYHIADNTGYEPEYVTSFEMTPSQARRLMNMFDTSQIVGRKFTFQTQQKQTIRK